MAAKGVVLIDESVVSAARVHSRVVPATQSVASTPQNVPPPER
jgi:hypothetical protein